MAYVNSLENIQSFIGNIDTWPSEIIYKIFMGEYNRRSVFRVLLFMYGNCIPIGLALHFYFKCNNHNKFLTVCHFTMLYSQWDNGLHSECACNNCAYYVMHLKRRMWVNRVLRERAGSPPIPLGIENTGTHAEHIRIKLLEVFGYVPAEYEPEV